MEGKMHEPTPGIKQEEAVDEGVKQDRYACEICNKQYEMEEAELANWKCCGQGMSRLEKLYRRSPSPTGA